MFRVFLVAVCFLPITACATADDDTPFQVEEIAAFANPWALAFLPDGRLLVTEKGGKLFIVTQDGDKSAPLSGLPDVDAGGQGGLGDIVLHPDFGSNRLVYFSYVEAGSADARGAAIARGRLSEDSETLTDVEVIWRQLPKVEGRGHYGHRLLFSADGMLFVASGERQKFDPAQDMGSNLGKILRLRDDGSPVEDNPFADQGGVTAEIWSLGHRNPLGIAFDSDGQLWNIEMGPKGGDELNRVVRGENYGYPIVSNGDHYSGKEIPDHDTHPEFAAPAVWWSPVISPAGFIIYSGSEFPEWQGNGLITGLSSQALVRIEFDGPNAKEAERFSMGSRVRGIAQGPDGAIWLLEDGGRLLKLTSTSWRNPEAENIVIMSLPQGDVTMELAPSFAPNTVANIKRLIKERYFDGLAIIRSQDNYVAQWGDWNVGSAEKRAVDTAAETIEPEFSRQRIDLDIQPVASNDAYAPKVGFADGFPVGYDDERAWLTHCYGMVGVGRGMAPNSGNGTSLYVVTGHAPRHLDKNITLVGRVLSGMEYLSTLPRGSGPLGFYEDEDQLVEILSLRGGEDADVESSVKILDTKTEAFAAYVKRRTTRSESWFVDPVGKIGICNLNPPIR